MNEKPLPHGAEQRLADLAREFVDRLDQAVTQNGHPADATLARQFRMRRELGARDRRFLSAVVFSHFRWHGWIRAAAVTPEVGLVASYLLDATTPHASIWRLARQAGFRTEALTPMGDRPIAEKASALANWLGLSAPPDVRQLVPAWVPDVLYDPHGTGFEDEAVRRASTSCSIRIADEHNLLQRCIASLQLRPPTWLRIARGHEQTVVAQLHAAGIQAEPHPRLAQAVAIQGSSALHGLPAHIQSAYEVQDLASQCVGLICAPQRGQRWWDVSAGSGGKALHLADLMRRDGCLLATDIRSSALKELHRRARRAGTRCIQTRLLSESVDERIPEPKDGVLVDAPCSGIGTWARNPDARWRTEPARIAESARIQGELLAKAAGAVKPDGRLVYSVCTLTSAETVAVVAAFLRERSDFHLESFAHPLSGDMTSGLASGLALGRSLQWDVHRRHAS